MWLSCSSQTEIQRLKLAKGITGGQFKGVCVGFGLFGDIWWQKRGPAGTCCCLWTNPMLTFSKQNQFQTFMERMCSNRNTSLLLLWQCSVHWSTLGFFSRQTNATSINLIIWCGYLKLNRMYWTIHYHHFTKCTISIWRRAQKTLAKNKSLQCNQQVKRKPTCQSATAKRRSLQQSNCYMSLWKDRRTMQSQMRLSEWKKKRKKQQSYAASIFLSAFMSQFSLRRHAFLSVALAWTL